MTQAVWRLILNGKSSGDEAVREAENKLLGVETNITNWQRKQN